MLLPGCAAVAEPFWKNFFFSSAPGSDVRPGVHLGARPGEREPVCVWRAQVEAEPGVRAEAVPEAAAPELRYCLAALVFAAAPAAPMPLRLPLAVGRSRPQFGLGLR